MKYQMVMIITLVRSRQESCCLAPAFALTCQYLSSAVQVMHVPLALHKQREKFHGPSDLQDKN
jgi:hypothetical protein